MGFATSCVDCPAGHVCADSPQSSVPLPCPAGEYSNKSATTCTKCNAGYACKGSDISPTPPSGLCSLGFYCPDGQQELACPSGTYGNVTGAASEAEGCPACPAGYFCPAGTRGYPTHRFVLAKLILSLKVSSDILQMSCGVEIIGELRTNCICHP